MKNKNDGMLTKVILAVSLGSVLAFFLLPHFLWQSPNLPTPTGSYPVGITKYYLIDANRKEIHEKNPETQRELIIQIWYPAVHHNNKKHRYLDPRSSEIIKKDLVAHFKIPLDQLSFLETIDTHAIDNAPLASKHAPFPVLIFSPGFGSPVTFYTSLLEELASHGYIAVGISYPYITSGVIFSDGRIITPIMLNTLQEQWKLTNEESAAIKEQEFWVQDIKFVIDQLKKINQQDPHNVLNGAFDFNRLGLFGHSFGGGVSLIACPQIPDCKAVVNIDGRPQGPSAVKGYATPSLFIRNPFQKKEKEELVRTLWNNMTGPSYYIVVNHALHGSFTDLFLFIPWKGEHSLKLDPLQGIKITRTLLTSFFDKYLKGDMNALQKLALYDNEIKISHH